VLMFLDLAGSTSLAESMGAHCACKTCSTRFFYDIDGRIIAHGGRCMPMSATRSSSPGRSNERMSGGRCASIAFLFFEIEDKIAGKADSYRQEFGMVADFPRTACIAGAVVIQANVGSSRPRQAGYSRHRDRKRRGLRILQGGRHAI